MDYLCDKVCGGSAENLLEGGAWILHEGLLRVYYGRSVPGGPPR